VRGLARVERPSALLRKRCAQSGRVGRVLRGGGGQALGVRLVVVLSAQRQRERE